MDEATERLFVERVSQDITLAVTPRLRELERQADRLLGEVRAMRARALASEKQVAVLTDKLAALQAVPIAAEEAAPPETEPRG